MTSRFTQAQQDCLTRCYDELSEHFDCVLLSVSSETESDTGELQSTSRMFHSGGFVQAVGLATLAQRDLLNSHGNITGRE
jgi:hypothetical protein